MSLFSRRVFSYFPTAIANREFSSDPLFVLSVATGFVYKVRGSYRIKQGIRSTVLIPQFSPQF